MGGLGRRLAYALTTFAMKKEKKARSMEKNFEAKALSLALVPFGPSFSGLTSSCGIKAMTVGTGGSEGRSSAA